MPGRRNNDDEKAVAAVLGSRKRGFILDVQVMNSSAGRCSDVAVDQFSLFRQSNKEKGDRETWKQAIPGSLKSTKLPMSFSISLRTQSRALKMVYKVFLCVSLCAGGRR